ncbi:MAG: heavy metal-binding domain-containing protein [Flavobacteriaceae bacterium]
MILTTSNSIEGFKIADYLGIVTGVSTNKQSVWKDDLEANIGNAKEEAFQQIKQHAANLKANAIIGIKVDIEFLEQRYQTVVSITGTAVFVQ